MMMMEIMSNYKPPGMISLLSLIITKTLNVYSIIVILQKRKTETKIIICQDHTATN